MNDSPANHTKLPYAEIVNNSSQVMEVDGEVDPKMKISNYYVVQLPSPDCNDEMILTPPLPPEESHRFSKPNLQGMQEHVEAKAAKLASKKNLEGNNQNTYKNSFAALSDTDLISRATNIGV